MGKNLLAAFVPVFVRSENNYDMKAASDACGLRPGEGPDDNLTRQSFAEECDINTIVKRFGLTGHLPQGVLAPKYGDYLGVTDFHSAMNAVAVAQESFERLPAEIRARFQNDPQALLVFCANDANRAEAEKLGLVMAASAEAAVEAPKAPVEGPKGSEKTS